MTEQSTPDYTLLDGPGVLKACGDDASKWAAAFCQHVKKIQGIDFDEGWAMAWFANAIEGACDTRRWRNEPTPEQIEALRNADSREGIVAVLDGIDPAILAQAGIV